MEKSKVRSLTLGGLMIALVFIATCIKIPIPFTQGYIHAGDSMIFMAAILLGWKHGAVAGGLGSALADVLGGYAHWALPTLVIKAIMGAVVGWIAHDLRTTENRGRSIIISTFIALIWFGFSYKLKTVIGNLLTSKSTELLGQVEGAATLEELLALAQKLQVELLWISILIPLIIIGLSIYLQKIDKALFAVNQLLGMLIAGLWMVSGYYIAAGIMYGSFIVPIFSIPWNIVQFVAGLVIAYFILLLLKRTPVTTHLKQI